MDDLRSVLPSPGLRCQCGVMDLPTSERRIARWRLSTQGLTHGAAAGAEEVVAHLLAVQAENVSQSAWAVATRTRDADPSSLGRALATGTVVRTHVLRPTWHYVRREDVDWLQRLTEPALAPQYERGLAESGLSGSHLDLLVGTVLELLARSPHRLRQEIGEHLHTEHPDLAPRLGGQTLMYLMAWCETTRLVVSGEPRGTGPDAEHTYARWEDRVGPRTDPNRFDRDQALADLALRYLHGHGPATVKDLTYWATLKVTDARRALDRAGEQLSSFEHDGRTFRYAGSPPAESALQIPTEPLGHLLQLLDETYRGYQDSRWVLDEDGVVPRGRETAIGMGLVDAQLVTRMRRRLTRRATGGGSVTFELEPFRPLADAELQALTSAAERYGRFLGLTPQVVLADAGSRRP